MSADIEKMHNIWDSLQVATRTPHQPFEPGFDELMSSIFGMGQVYHYLIDFYDMGISHLSSGFKAAHGIENGQVGHINDILSLIHPDDMNFVAGAEKKVMNYLYHVLGADKLRSYKASYNFRFRTADGTYRLYNHQSLILKLDQQNNIVKSLNIHTDISHLGAKNNYRCSLIGLAGEPSFLDLEVEDSLELIGKKKFSRRETEVIALLAKGFTTAGIARQLFISVDTVKFHRRNILLKSGCANVAELVARSISEAWV